MKNDILITKILEGISKGLGVAGKLLPIVSDSKPLANNVKSIYNKISHNTNKPVESKKTITNNSNSPKFFI